jgi:hypothetical protein
MNQLVLKIFYTIISDPQFNLHKPIKREWHLSRYEMPKIKILSSAIQVIENSNSVH